MRPPARATGIQVKLARRPRLLSRHGFGQFFMYLAFFLISLTGTSEVVRLVLELHITVLTVIPY